MPKKTFNNSYHLFLRICDCWVTFISLFDVYYKTVLKS